MLRTQLLSEWNGLLRWDVLCAGLLLPFEYLRTQLHCVLHSKLSPRRVFRIQLHLQILRRSQLLFLGMHFCVPVLLLGYCEYNGANHMLRRGRYLLLRILLVRLLS